MSADGVLLKQGEVQVSLDDGVGTYYWDPPDARWAAVSREVLDRMLVLLGYTDLTAVEPEPVEEDTD